MEENGLFLQKEMQLKDGRYRIQRVIGHGGFGITYLAEDCVLQNLVAIKEFFPTELVFRNKETKQVFTVNAEAQAEFEAGKKAFQQEAAVLARNQQLSGIVDVLDFFTENQTAYLVMEYLDGETLQTYRQALGRIPAAWLAERLAPLMDDLGKLHAAGVVHGDISPDNIILTKDGRLVLIDFGSASVVPRQPETVFLKMAYAAPEVYAPGGQRPEADIYALCATFYDCVTGKKPLSAAERAHKKMKWPSQLDPQLQASLDRVLRRGMALRASRRYRSMKALKQAMCRAMRPRVHWPYYAVSAAVLLAAALLFWSKRDAESLKPAFSASPQPAAAETAEDPVQTPAADADEPEEVRLYSLELVQAGNKQTYYVGDALDTNGLELLATYTDNSRKELTAQDVAIQYDFSASGEREVVLEYEGKSVSFLVEVLPDMEKDYQQAQSLLQSGDSLGAARAFFALGDYRDARDRASELWDVISRRKTISAARDGSSYAAITEQQTCAELEGAEGLVDIVCADGYCIGLKNDGTLAVPENLPSELGQIRIWTDIVALGAGSYYLMGVRADGSVVAAGSNSFGECDVGDWSDVVTAEGSFGFSYAVRTDGTLCANRELSASNVVDVACGNYFVAVLLRDGTVQASGSEITSGEDVSQWTADWTDIVAIDASDSHIVGLKADGTVVTAGPNYSGRCDVSEWRDIVQIAAGGYCTLGLKADGTVVYAGVNADQKQQPVLTGIRVPARG